MSDKISIVLVNCFFTLTFLQCTMLLVRLPLSCLMMLTLMHGSPHIFWKSSKTCIPGKASSTSTDLSRLISVKIQILDCNMYLYRKVGSMTYAPTTNAPTRNSNVEAYINPNPNLNPNPNPNPYPALNQKPNYTPQSNSVSGEVSMPEQLSAEHMSCHRKVVPKIFLGPDTWVYGPQNHCLEMVEVVTKSKCKFGKWMWLSWFLWCSICLGLSS